MIIVKIHGGLGNQLFQYSYGLYLSNLLNTEVKYEIQMSFDSKNYTNRSLELGIMGFMVEKASCIDIRKFKFFKKGLKFRIERKLISRLPFLNSNYKIENNPHIIIDVPKDNAFYDGYWQNLDMIYKVLPHLKSIISQSNSEITQKFNSINIENSVSIHIRRGDYISVKSNSEIFEICKVDYFINAINYIKQNSTNPSFLIFSDDIEWAKLQFIGDEYKFMEGNTAVEDLLLMSLCRHNIIANSTFSWWGAMLNSFEGKIVIAPKKWYVGELNNSINYLLPASWMKL